MVRGGVNATPEVHRLQAGVPRELDLVIYLQSLARIRSCLFFAYTAHAGEQNLRGAGGGVKAHDIFPGTTANFEPTRSCPRCIGTERRRRKHFLFLARMAVKAQDPHLNT